jgi:hypothetical protein
MKTRTLGALEVSRPMPRSPAGARRRVQIRWAAVGSLTATGHSGGPEALDSRHSQRRAGRFVRRR